MDIRHCTAVVTGGASGLGHATARALVEHGAHVFAFDLPASIEKVPAVEGLDYVTVDVTDAESVRAGLEQVRAASTGPLRVVVNCAGIGPAARVLGKKGVHDLGLFAKVVQVNLVGTFQVLALAAEQMAREEPVDADGQRGVVINTASVAAFEGQIGQAAYASSKGGVASLTLPAARDLAGQGIRVNTIAPGLVDTPMMAGVTEEFRESLAQSVPFPHRLARPEEYAKLALAIIDNDYINGQVTRLDGAIRMQPR